MHYLALFKYTNDDYESQAWNEKPQFLLLEWNKLKSL